MRDSVNESKKIVLCVSGSIAAYKAVELARLFVKAGHEVRCAMTEGATRFVAPLTFEAITNSSVFTSLWSGSMTHISLPTWGDVIVVAPLSADLLSRLAHGNASCPVSSLLLATKVPVLLAPAMNVGMWEHPATQENIAKVKGFGAHVVNPDNGELACGWKGDGRLAEPERIFMETQRVLCTTPFWRGKKVVVTAGATREPLDPTRFLSNYSSGAMGVSLCEAFYQAGADVELVHAALSVSLPSWLPSFKGLSTDDLSKTLTSRVVGSEPLEGCQKRVPDFVVMAAAVSDIHPKNPSLTKISKKELLKPIEIEENPDIIGKLVQLFHRSPLRPVFVAFCLETEGVEMLHCRMNEKLLKKEVDFIIGNRVQDAIDSSTNRVWILARGKVTPDELPFGLKKKVARSILQYLEKHASL
jgi:phosphopantothenoylcysteine decarboxylase / phosphopantothenate---cysteine ligase